MFLIDVTVDNSRESSAIPDVSLELSDKVDDLKQRRV